MGFCEGGGAVKQAGEEEGVFHLVQEERLQGRAVEGLKVHTIDLHNCNNITIMVFSGL